jgi:hypothetical protein
MIMNGCAIVVIKKDIGEEKIKIINLNSIKINNGDGKMKMKKTKTIPLFVESKRGHDTIDVPETDLPKEIATQLTQDKWVTLEKENSDETELLTKADLPKINAQDDDDDEEEDNEEEEEELIEEKATTTEKPKFNPFGVDKATKSGTTTTTATTTAQKKDTWTSKFEKVKSATAYSPSKGG